MFCKAARLRRLVIFVSGFFDLRGKPIVASGARGGFRYRATPGAKVWRPAYADRGTWPGEGIAISPPTAQNAAARRKHRPCRRRAAAH